MDLGGTDSQRAFYAVLVDRLRSLEASHEKLKEQFDILSQETGRLCSSTTDDVHNNDNNNIVSKKSSLEDGGGEEELINWAYIPGTFISGYPYKKALDCMGHAIHITRAATSAEIIFWNRSAEKLYGYKDHEALGQREEALIIDERHNATAGRITERLNFVRFWSGQLPFKKKSGEIFMALVTKSRLYENGELVGIITVSSDAAVFNDLGQEGPRVGQNSIDSKFGGINLKRLQCQAQPSIASSISNLASKVLPQRDGDSGQDGFSNIKEKEQNELDIPDTKSERPPRAPATKPTYNSRCAKNRFPGEGSDNEESPNECSPPLNFAQKVFAKLNIGGSGNFGKGKDRNIQHNGFGDASLSQKILVEPSSPEAKATTTSPNRAAQYDAVPTGNNEFPREAREPERWRRSESANSRENTGSLPSSLSKGDAEPNLNVHYQIKWEDLQLREEVGQGSFAVVYRGIWTGSDVAVKVYHGTEYNDDTLAGYSKELDIMRRLRHPNVLLFMGAVCSDEKLALVTEFLPRGSLYKALHKSNQNLDIRRRFRMALDVARGMNYLHHRNPPIVHRDLKSSNLLVDKSWTVKVGDFGLSKLKEATFLTAKSGRGTPQWMAPEVLRNEPSTEKSDVFSFGVILWELMTESIPWNNLNVLQVVGVVGFMDRRLDLPENLDPKVSSVIEDCWQSKAENRPSFEDIIQRMADIIQSPRSQMRE